MAKVGSVIIETPVMNAACSVAKSVEDVEALSKTNVGAIMVGSITVEPREGNPEPRWFTGNGFALNSFGMPNGGLEFYRTNLPKMRDIAHKAGKKIALSIAGFATSEYVTLAELAREANVDLLELNFGCPNVTIDGKQKAIVSFDPESMQEIIRAVGEVTDTPLMVKLSPYSNPAELIQVAKVINESGKVSGVVTANTFPNGYQTSGGDPVLASTFGGVSGRVMLPISLGQVRQFRQALDSEIAVIGVGGIETGDDARQYFDAGAEMVQCATLIVKEGHTAIDRII
jgi:dihydroorotate dehydrogenase (fumarate)